MEENYLYAMNKCLLLLLVLSYGKDKAFAIQGKPQFEQTNGPFNQFINLTVTVRLQVGSYSYVLGYLYQKGMCLVDSEYYTIKLHDVTKASI